MVTVDPEFKSLIDALTEQEHDDLEKSISDNGFNKAFPIILWKGHDNIIVDGYNRYEICQKLGIEPEYVEQEFESREAVKEWMVKAQLARRNLSPEQLAYFRGLRYNTEKASYGGSGCKTCNLKTNEKLAKEFGVSARTVSNDGKYSAVIDRICQVCDVSKQEILRGFKRTDILGLADTSDNKLKSELEKLSKEEKKKKTAKGSCPYYLEFSPEMNKKITTLARGDVQRLFENLIDQEFERRGL